MIILTDYAEEEVPIIHNEPTEQYPADETNNTQPTSLEPAEEETTKPRWYNADFDWLWAHIIGYRGVFCD